MLFVLVWLSSSAQVPAVFSISRHADHVGLEIQWSIAEANQWHEENDGRLESMGLRIGLSGDVLAREAEEQYRFNLQEDAPSRMEWLVRVSRIEPNERLFLRDITSGQLLCDFTAQNRPRFLTPSFDPAETELVWTGTTDKPRRSQWSVDLMYYTALTGREALDIGFGTALACHPNAACKTDSLSRLISSSAVRLKLVMEEGTGWCTGSLVNNTRNDKTPYLLTAFHCQWNYTPLYDQWRADFQYASATCPNPAAEPSFFSMTGCALVSSGQASDYLLVRLDQAIPTNQEVTFAGWDRKEADIPDTAYMVHHPNADIRKFSTCTNTIVIHPNQIGWSEGYSTPANHHFRLKFTEGGHEPGSSGAPVFNQQRLLVGQLHGGTSGCEAAETAFIGRLAKSWNLGTTPQTRLSDWLDPDNTGVETLSSIQNINPGDAIDIIGQVVDPKGKAVKNATIHVSGSVSLDLVTGADGGFVLSSVDRNGTYTITPEKTDHPSNGLNILDCVSLQKHLLGKDTFDFPWQYIAADATNNGELSVGDILLTLRLLLGKIPYYPSSPSWRFDPPQVQLHAMPPGQPTQVTLTAIKIGDVNGTADPSQ